MKKFKLSKIPFPSDLKIIKNFFSNENSEEIAKLNKNIFMQIGLAFFTIVLTVVILFAMTSAWYTNIAQTSGLVFEVEPWGFDGEIITSEKAVEAGPGDNGIVHLEAENNSDGIIDISVNVSKSGMSPEMQKRMFFYVETSATREGETMERVYVNNHEGYTYTVFNQSSLTLTEKVNNAPKLKWQWVYDVLGYYVLGTENGGSITVEEYLRPIEYDYDKATFVKTGDSEENTTYKLLTVDGETAPEDFLYMISATDGYEENINTSKSIGGYYPVEVDENGYGVYAYLCSYSEIETAIMDDTKMGILAQKKANGEEVNAELTYRAQLNVSAQKNEAPAVSVSNPETLKAIIDSGDYNYVQLSSDINIDSLEIPDGAKIMIDLGGNTISGTAAKVVDAKPGSSVTMVNGTVSGPAEGTAVNAVGAEVNMSNINISGMHYGVYVGDSNDNNVLDSTVRIVGSTIETESCAVFVSGNGLASEQKTTVVIEKSTLKSEGIVISGNGTTTGNGRWGTDINIIDSEIINENGIGAGIYQPQKDSTLTIYSSTVSGYTAIALKAGSAKIIDSTIEGTGTYNEPAFGNSGFSDTGDAVYIETGYGHDINLEIDEIDGTSILTSTHGQSLRVFKEDAPFVKINIISGEFDEAQPEKYIAEGSVQNGTKVSVLQSSEE